MTYKTATNKQGTQNDIKRIHKWLQIHPKTCKVTSQLQHTALKMLLCIQIGTGKMGKMTTNRKHTKTQKLQSDENTKHNRHTK